MFGRCSMPEEKQICCSFLGIKSVPLGLCVPEISWLVNKGTKATNPINRIFKNCSFASDDILLNW